MRHIKLSLLAIALFTAAGTVVANERLIADGWYLTDGSGPFATKPSQCNALRILCANHYVNNTLVETAYQN